jgi:hypothetical protein
MIMYKLFFFSILFFSTLTVSCIPVQLTNQEINEFQDPVEIIVIIEEPIIISPPPRPPVRPISKPPIQQHDLVKSKKDNIAPPKQNTNKRPTTPLQPVRKVRKK